MTTRLRRIRAAARTSWHRLTGELAGHDLRCCLCGCRVPAFLPFPAELIQELERAGFPMDLFRGSETLNADQYHCPVCRSTDRERLVGLFLERVLAMDSTPRLFTMLDVAPSPPLQAHILRTRRFAYRSVDLTDPRADDRADIQDLGIYGDGTFDCVLCSHVLEHVSDDRRALRELRRVLRPDGWAALLAPIALPLRETREDPMLADPHERIRLFGQSDHLRLYARSDFIERIVNAGFREVRPLDARFFGPASLDRHGISATSVLYVAVLRNTPPFT